MPNFDHIAEALADVLAEARVKAEASQVTAEASRVTAEAANIAASNLRMLMADGSVTITASEAIVVAEAEAESSNIAYEHAAEAAICEYRVTEAEAEALDHANLEAFCTKESARDEVSRCLQYGVDDSILAESRATLAEAESALVTARVAATKAAEARITAKGFVRGATKIFYQRGRRMVA